MIGDDAEKVEDRLEHFAVLPGDAQSNLQLIGTCAQGAHDRAKLDRLGTRAEDHEDTGPAPYLLEPRTARPKISGFNESLRSHVSTQLCRRSGRPMRGAKTTHPGPSCFGSEQIFPAR